jgi:hypothetical protein
MYALNSIEYSKGCKVQNLTFVFGDGSKSPPSKTYKSAPEKSIKLFLGKIKMVDLGVVDFGLHYLTHSVAKETCLRSISLVDRDGKTKMEIEG